MQLKFVLPIFSVIFKLQLVLYYRTEKAIQKTLIFDGTNEKLGIKRSPGWITLKKGVDTVALTYHDYHYNYLELNDEQGQQE